MLEKSMRNIIHPGPVIEPALQSLPARVLTVLDQIPAGVSLLEGFDRLLGKYGCQSAVARLGSSSLWPVVYVLPALSKSREHAVYYSDRHVPGLPVSLNEGTVTVGLRDGATWLHCHASWYESDGSWHCGHLLPDETYLAQPLEVELSLLADAGFVVCADIHTNFNLFKPRVLSLPAHSSLASSSAWMPGWCVRVAPNVDLCHVLETFCETEGIESARILGGVGSTVGAAFSDGRVVQPFVTELLIGSGVIQSRAGIRHAMIDVALIDYQGGVHRGRLARGENPVLVTCELLLLPEKSLASGIGALV